MSASRRLIENAETQVRRAGNQLSKHGTLDASDIVNLLDDARWYCELKGIDFDSCWQQHLARKTELSYDSFRSAWC